MWKEKNLLYHYNLYSSYFGQVTTHPMMFGSKVGKKIVVIQRSLPNYSRRLSLITMLSLFLKLEIMKLILSTFLISKQIEKRDLEKRQPNYGKIGLERNKR